MNRDGMWFENEEHYAFYKRKMQPVWDAHRRASDAMLLPLINRMKAILKRKGIEVVLGDNKQNA